MSTLFDLLGDVEAPAVDVPYRYEPRPDLTGDSVSWQTVLELAFVLDGENGAGVYGALHGMRCCGARIIRYGKRFRLEADDDYWGDWREDCARWLLPYRDAITALLKAVQDDE